MEPAVRWRQVLVYGPRNDLHEALLAVAAQQAVEVWAAAGVVHHHPVDAQQPAGSQRSEDPSAVRPQKNEQFTVTAGSPVHLQALGHLEHVVIVSKQGGDAHREVTPFVRPLLRFKVSHRKPHLFRLFPVLSVCEEAHVSGEAAFGNRAHHVSRHVGKTEVVRVLKNGGFGQGWPVLSAAEQAVKGLDGVSPEYTNDAYIKAALSLVHVGRHQ